MKRSLSTLFVLMFGIALFAQGTSSNAETIAQRDKELVGVWQLTMVRNGVNFYQPEYKYYNADHTWFTLRTYMGGGGIYAGGTWRLTDANTIVEHNDFSVTQLYVNSDVVLHVNKFSPNHHQITFTPFEVNHAITFDYEKVPTSTNGRRCPSPTDAVYFNRLEDYPYARDGKPHYIRVKNHEKEEISADELPESVRAAVAQCSYLGGKSKSPIYVVIAFRPDGQPTSCIKKGSSYSRKSPRRIYFDEADADKAVDINETLSMMERELEDETLYYLVYSQVRER